MIQKLRQQFETLLNEHKYTPAVVNLLIKFLLLQIEILELECHQLCMKNSDELDPPF